MNKQMRAPKKPLPSQDRLLELYYCVGGVFYRRVSTRGAQGMIGDTPGCAPPHRYRTQSVDNYLYYTHRLVWKYYYGTDPQGEIDHIDRDRSNNNIWNLRSVTPSENNINKERVERNGGPLMITDSSGKRTLTPLGRKFNRERSRKNYHKNKQQHKE